MYAAAVIGQTEVLGKQIALVLPPQTLYPLGQFPLSCIRSLNEAFQEAGALTGTGRSLKVLAVTVT